MAAGDVSAELTSKGDLKIKGSNDSNQIMVTNDGFGNIRVEGMAPTGTTVNGGSGRASSRRTRTPLRGSSTSTWETETTSSRSMTSTSKGT